MTRAEYLKFHRECCDRMVETTAKKNADYSGGDPDPFYNFTRVEAIGIASTEQGFLTRMFDKFARITTFVKKGVLQVSDESVEDTLIDLANYAILMAGYIRHKRQQSAAPRSESIDPEHAVDALKYVRRGWDCSCGVHNRASDPRCIGCGCSK